MADGESKTWHKGDAFEANLTAFNQTWWHENKLDGFIKTSQI